MRFLILEGNVKTIREAYRAGQGVTPAENYGRTLVEVAGEGSFDVLHAADVGASLPQGVSFGDYDGVAMTGSSLHLWKAEPEALRQIEVARAVFRANVPFFGSCWGLQVAAVAAGGEVHSNPKGRELGIARKIMPNEAGRAHPLLQGRMAVYDAPCSHCDEVAVLPPDSTLLASNAVSNVQAAEFRFEGGRFWGVQYHPEYNLDDLAFLIEKRIPGLVEEGFFTDESEKKTYAEDLRLLERNPPPRAIAWRHGLDADVILPRQRRSELHNFIDLWVKNRQ